MISLDGDLTTDDMVFAVVLCLNGYHPEMERRDNGVYWIIEAVELDEDIHEFVSLFNRGGQIVEPRRFAREWGAMRKDVYKLMNVEGQPRGARVHRQSPSR